MRNVNVSQRFGIGVLTTKPWEWVNVCRQIGPVETGFMIAQNEATTDYPYLSASPSYHSHAGGRSHVRNLSPGTHPTGAGPSILPYAVLAANDI
jgi:hypothetical protein